MKRNNKSPTNTLPQGRKTKKTLESTNDTHADSGITQLQLIIYQQLQTSLNSHELLTLLKNTLPSTIGITNIIFTPVFHTQTAIEDKNIAPNTHKIKLFTGQDYVGQLNIEFETLPTPALLNTVEEIGKLIAYPLRNAMEYEQALKNSELDALTNLKNRKAMNLAISKACDAAKRYHFPVSILMLDIDHFKKINDTYGHLTGDKILQKFASLVQQSCRLTDDAFRFGGEEFLMLLPNTNTKGAFEMAERLRKSIEINDLGGAIEEKDLPVTISIGVATDDGTNAHQSTEQFIEKADQALYTAKKKGRNRSICFSYDMT